MEFVGVHVNSLDVGTTRRWVVCRMVFFCLYLLVSLSGHNLAGQLLGLKCCASDIDEVSKLPAQLLQQLVKETE